MKLYQLVSVVYDLWLVYTAVLSSSFSDDSCPAFFEGMESHSLVEPQWWNHYQRVWSAPHIHLRDNIAEAISGSMALLEPTTQKLIHIKHVNTDKLKVQ